MCSSLPLHHLRRQRRPLHYCLLPLRGRAHYRGCALLPGLLRRECGLCRGCLGSILYIFRRPLCTMRQCQPIQVDFMLELLPNNSATRSGKLSRNKINRFGFAIPAERFGAHRFKGPSRAPIEGRHFRQLKKMKIRDGHNSTRKLLFWAIRPSNESC